MKTSTLAIVLLLASVVTAQEKSSQPDLLSAIAAREKINPQALRSAVDLPEVASTPEQALDHFTRAAIDGDVDAALKFIDPEVRPLIALEASIDHVVMNQKFQDSIAHEMDKSRPKSVVIGFSPLFANREILQHKEFRVLEKRTIDADRVILRVCRTTGKFGTEGDNRFFDEVLAVKRETRWYLFYCIGYVNMAFESPPLGDVPGDFDSPKASDAASVFSLLHESESHSLPEGIGYEKVFHIPIHVVHAEMIVAARHPAILECQHLQRRVERMQRNLQNRLLRGDFENVSQWNAANKPVDDSLEINANALAEVVGESHQRLVRQLASQAKPLVPQ